MILGIMVPVFTIFFVTVLACVQRWEFKFFLFALAALTYWMFGVPYAIAVAVGCSVCLYLKEFLPHMSRSH